MIKTGKVKGWREGMTMPMDRPVTPQNMDELGKGIEL